MTVWPSVGGPVGVVTVNGLVIINYFVTFFVIRKYRKWQTRPSRTSIRMREDSVERLLGAEDKPTQKFTQTKNERTKVRSKNRRKKECDFTRCKLNRDSTRPREIISRVRDHYVYIYYPSVVNTYPLGVFFYYSAVLYISNLGSSETSWRIFVA